SEHDMTPRLENILNTAIRSHFHPQMATEALRELAALKTTAQLAERQLATRDNQLRERTVSRTAWKDRALSAEALLGPQQEHIQELKDQLDDRPDEADFMEKHTAGIKLHAPNTKPTHITKPAFDAAYNIEALKFEHP